MEPESPITQRHGDPKEVEASGKQSYTQGVTAVEGEPSSSAAPPAEPGPTLEDIREQRSQGWFAYLKTRNFYVLLVLGQVLALALTATNTFTTFLVQAGTSIPAFQTFFNYVLLNLLYTTYTVYRYGPRGYGRFLWKNWWRYIILSFCDVEGNYFTVLAYRYTTILSAQLINFWAIVVVVLVSFGFLKVRYHWAQIVGILIAIGGLGILFASDHITGANASEASDVVKGDLFALLGATFYGLANVFEEVLVSERPAYEVVGQIGFWGMIIIGVQAGIFDRDSFASATWNPQVGGYLAGYTLCLALFYTLVPFVMRMGSAAFFNISLLTTNFWGTIVGVQVSSSFPLLTRSLQG